MTVRFLQKTSNDVVTLRGDCGFCESQLNLLAHAQTLELDIGSECGGHGRCGKDRVVARSSAPLSPLTELEKKHLSPEEISQGVRLACQCFPEQKDQTIDVYSR